MGIIGIYWIVNQSNDNVEYVGSSRNIAARLLFHERSLSRGNHDNRSLQEKWDKYGGSAFELKLLEEMPACTSRKVLLEREEFWINLLAISDNLCNVRRRALGSPWGLVPTDKQRVARKENARRMGKLPKTQKQLDAISSAMKKGRHQVASQKQLLHLRKIASLPRTERQKEATAHNAIKARAVAWVTPRSQKAIEWQKKLHKIGTEASRLLPRSEKQKAASLRNLEIARKNKLAKEEKHDD